MQCATLIAPYILGVSALRPQPHPQLCIHILPRRHGQDGQQAFGVVDMVDQAVLRRGDFYLVAVGQFAQRIFCHARVLEAFAGEFFLEAALDAAIQFRPFLFGVRMEASS